MAISNNSTGLRPGVCTSTTRPTAPYEGQHIYETDTDIEYVWNGSAWVVNYVSANSPAFAGTPTAPTANSTTNNTQIATTAFANVAGGLVFIKSQSVGSAVASVTVSDAFSATYDNYKVQYSGATSLATGNVIDIRLGTTATGYYGALQYASYTGVGGSVVGDNNVVAWSHCAGANQNQTNLNVEFFNPFKTQISSMSTSFYADNANTGQKTGWLNNTTSYTAFTLFAATGTFTGGTVTVYGYRK